MSKAAVIKAEFTDYRPIKTRKVLQLVFEVPAESQGEVFKALGYPIMGSSLWVAIARLAEPLPSGAPAPERSEPVADKARTPFRELPRSQQAALKCQDRDFFGWLSYLPEFNDVAGDISNTATNEQMADAVLKRLLGITSKKELDVPGPAQDAFDKLMTDYDMRGYTR